MFINIVMGLTSILCNLCCCIRAYPPDENASESVEGATKVEKTVAEAEKSKATDEAEVAKP